VFHALAWALFRIPFVSLWMLYVVLIDPRAVTRFAARWLRTDATLSEPRSLVTTWVVGALLTIGVVVQGIRGQMRSYPFACYPTFEWIVGMEMPDLLVEAEDEDGQFTIVPHARNAFGYRTQRQWGEIWSLVGITGSVDGRRLRTYVTTIAAREPASSLTRRAVRIRCFRAFVSVVPERRADPPRRAEVLADFAWP